MINIHLRRSVDGQAGFIRAALIACLLLPGMAYAERLSLGGLKQQIDAVDARLADCEQGVDGACRGAALNVITVALEGGDFTSIQAAIDSVPVRPIPAPPGFPIGDEVTPTLIRVAPGEYYEQIRLRDNIRLQGSGRNQTMLRAPDDLNADCNGRSPLICVANVSDVEITDLGFSGFSQAFSNQAETAIALAESTSVRITGTFMTNVVEGIIGEASQNILIRDNQIPFPADAIVLSAMGGLVSIVGNQIDGGQVSVNGPGTVHIIGNTISGGLINEWGGQLHASGNRILGDVFFEGYDDSLFSGNTLLGSLYLESGGEITVVGNSIWGDSYSIFDNGAATIVGNTLDSPINALPNSESTLFANSFEGGGTNQQHNSLVSNNQIRLESRNENVTIKAGDSTITVDAAGAITIDSATDINLTSGGKFTVVANGIELRSATTLKAEGSAGAELKSGAITVIQGSLVRIN